MILAALERREDDRFCPMISRADDGYDISMSFEQPNLIQAKHAGLFELTPIDFAIATVCVEGGHICRGDLWVGAPVSALAARRQSPNTTDPRGTTSLPGPPLCRFRRLPV